MTTKEMRTRRLRVGVAGLGGFGSLHLGVLAQAASVELVAVCDTDSARVDEVVREYGIPHSSSTLDELLTVEGLDAVFLVTPEHLHAEMVMKVAAAGVNCFVEKPIATDAASAKEMVAVSDKAGIRLQVGHVLRFEAQHAMLQDSVAQGDLGKVLLLRAKRNCPIEWWETSGKSAHVVFANLVHDVDQILWLTQGQRCEAVYAVERYVSGHPFPDFAVATLQFSGGTVATLETGWSIPKGTPANIVSPNWSGHIDASLEVVGTEATAQLNVFQSGLTIWSADRTIIPSSTLWPMVHGQIAGALREEDMHFLETIRSGKPSSIALNADAIHGIEILEAVVESAKAKKEVRL